MRSNEISYPRKSLIKRLFRCLGGPLEEGKLEGYEIECPWHGSRFDVRTGEVRNPPADTPQSVYEVKVENNDILIRRNLESKTQGQGQPVQTQVSREAQREKGAAVYQLKFLEKQKFEGTDVMSFKFSRQEEQRQPQEEAVDRDDSNKRYLDYTAGLEENGYRWS